MRSYSWKKIFVLEILSLLFVGIAHAASPTITTLSPTSGAIGASVTITGTNFGSTKGTSTVKFNTATATTTSWNATTIVATVPAGSTTGKVVVTVSGTASNGVTFTVVPAPSITSLSPTSGAVGASVTITGTNFGATQGAGTVTFSGTTATVGTWSATSITTTVPTGATTGNVVVNAGGVASNGSSFTVVSAPSITSLSPTSGAVGASVTITGTNFGTTQGTGTVKFNGTTATVGTWSATSITTTVPAGATTGNVIVNTSGGASNGVTFTVSTLPTGWSDGDIGNVGLSGSASYSGGTFTVNGAGNASNGVTADAFHFVYQPLLGDGTIVARVVGASNGLSQAGVMIRESLDPSATGMFVADYAGQIYIFPRTTTGASSGYAYNGGATLPYWVKVVRSGTSFTGYASPDGINWVQVGASQTISMVQNVYVGLGVSSGSTSSLYTGTFDSVSVSSTANPAPVITSLSATTGPIGSSVTVYGTGFGASQGNSAVLLNGTPVTINSWGATSILVTIPAAATSGNVVVSVAPSMNDSNPVDFTVTSTPLAAGWLDADIGQVGLDGSASYASGLFTVNAAGAGVECLNANCGIDQHTIVDGFHFVYQTLSGDGTIIARIVSTSASYNQAGVMIRETLDTSAKSVFASYNAGYVYAFYRTLSGGYANYALDNSKSAPIPYWVKLVRSGNYFNAYESADGISWIPVGGSLPISMAQNVYIGLAASSTSSGTLATATFDNVSISSTAIIAPVITGLSTTTGPTGSQVVISGSGFGTSQGSSSVVLNDVPVPISSWSASSITVTIPTGATSGLFDVLIGPSMNSSNGVGFTVTSQPLLAGWFDQDIGSVGLAGNASYANGVFTVTGAGTGLQNSADGFHFVYQPMSTDGTIMARVVSSGGASTPQAGVMIRETLDAGSAEVSAMSINYTSSIGSYLYDRLYAGSSTLLSGGPSGNLPYWLKVVRSTNMFSAYGSADGTTWTQIGNTLTLTTAQTVYVGLVVTSNNTAAAATASFDNVSIMLGGSLANPRITGISPTKGSAGASVTISGSGFGAAPGGSSVTFNGAGAAISSWSDTQIVAIVPDGATSGPVAVTVGNITSEGPVFTLAFASQLTDSLGNQTSLSSSLIGGQWAYTTAQGSGCSSCTTRGNIQNQYDAYGNVLWTTDAMGNTTIYKYDSSNNVTSQSVQADATTTLTTTYTYNNFGEVLSATDPLRNVTTNTYDANGNLLTVTTPAPSGSAASVTQFAYDTKGELIQITDPLNNVTTLTYWPTGLINTITDAQHNVTTYAYDAHGNRTSVTDSNNQITSFAYDTGDRLKTITYPGSAGTTTFTYDSRGRRTAVTDQNNRTTTYAYDDADRLTSITDAASPGNVTTYAYDTENNLSSITDAKFNTTSFTYDAFRRVTKTTFPSGVEMYSYDANNNLTSKTDRKNQYITYTYDQLNRLTQKSYPDSTSLNYIYDNDSRLTQVTDSTGAYQFVFDNMGRLTGTTTSYNFVPRAFTASYAYDAASNRTGFTDPESGTTSYVYDTLNRLQTLTPPAAISGGSFGFGYDALSRRTSLTRPNAVNTSYSYDNLSRLLSVTHANAGVTLDGATYTVDNAGNRLSKTDLQAGATSNYTYDPIYQLTGVTKNSTTTESYSYDPVGNRLSSLGVSSYNNNTSNELTSTPTTTYTYDANGNMLTKTDSTGTTTYAWDFENRLTSVTLPGTGGAVTFKYDPFGRRIYKSSGSGTSIFAYDGDNLVEETNSSGAAVARYSQTQNIDEPLAMLRSSTMSYYHADGLGSVTSLSNAAGSLAQTYGYDSFGKQLSSTGSLTNPFLYTARESDTETGLYYYRARYYDPNVGRFLSEDPIGYRAGPDFYAYASNNPSNVIDPSGLLQVCCRPAHIGDKMFWLPKGKKPCHCFIKLSDGNTMGGYNKPPGILQKKLGDDDDKRPKDTPKCSDVPGSECKVRQAFDNYPTYQPYGLAGSSNTVSAQILSDAGISYTFPSCAWGSGIPEVNVPQPFNPYSPSSPWPVPLR